MPGIRIAALKMANVRLRNRQPRRLLSPARTGALPHPDAPAAIVQQEHVVAVEVPQRDAAAVPGQLKGQPAAGVAETEQPRRTVGSLAGRLAHRAALAEAVPGRVVVTAAEEEVRDAAGSRLDLRNDLDVNVLGERHVVDDLGGLGLFRGAAAPALPDPDLVADVEDEDVAVVQAADGGLDLVHHEAAGGALEDAQQRADGRAGGLRLDVAEAGARAARPDGEAREQREELVRRRGLHLAVLRGGAGEELVQLDRLVGGGAGLVLRRVAAQPEEDVVA